MAPWAQIAKPFSLYFALNCIKTVVGAGFVGYGMALLAIEIPRDDDDDHKTDVEKAEENNRMGNPWFGEILYNKYVQAATTIGFGLFLALPSIASQVVWETMMPGITAADIAYDLGTENVVGILPKFKKPILSNLVPSKGKEIVGGLIREAEEAMAKSNDSSSSRSD